jgi:hypothetical protein
MDSEAACMSDAILCNNLTYHDYLHRKDNDRAFCWRMNGCILPDKKPIDVESHLWKKEKEAMCGEIMNIRAGNAKDYICPHPTATVGYDNMSSAPNMNDYLMVPCRINTYRNYIACDDKKCCSIRHQMFMNHTKRI